MGIVIAGIGGFMEVRFQSPDNWMYVYGTSIELFGFLLAQKIAASPLTPKDTSKMARSFPGTYTFTTTSEGSLLNYTTPFYTEFVHDGTRNLKARPFVNNIINSEGEQLLKQSFRITNAKYSNK